MLVRLKTLLFLLCTVAITNSKNCLNFFLDNLGNYAIIKTYKGNNPIILINKQNKKASNE